MPLQISRVHQEAKCATEHAEPHIVPLHSSPLGRCSYRHVDARGNSVGNVVYGAGA